MVSYIEANRLILRSWQEKDKEAFAKLNSDPAVMQYFPGVLSKNESDTLYEKIQNHFVENNFGLYAVELKSEQKFIGFCGIQVTGLQSKFSKIYKPAIEIAWRLASKYWGQNLATEAALAAIDHSWKVLRLPFLISFTSQKNTASQRVMQKIGMRARPELNFEHPALPKDHPLSRHVFYALENPRN